MRVLLTLAALAGCSAFGCSGGDQTMGGPGSSTPVVSVDDQTRPLGVPTDARLVTRDLVLGEATGGSPTAGSAQLFFTLGCRDDILTVVTTSGAVFAQVPCDRVPPDDAVTPFRGKPVRIRLSVSASSKLRIESTAAGSIEFTVKRAWAKAP